MNDLQKKIDFYVVGLFFQVFTLTCILFISSKDNDEILTFIMLGLVFFTIIITYTGGMIVGLIATSISIFLYSLYIFYNNLILNVEINYISYIWMVFLSTITITVGKLSQSIIKIQDINSKLKSEYNDLVTIDQNTGLGNIKNFYKYLNKEIRRTQRHGFKLNLIMINLPYYTEIKGIIGNEKYNKLIKDIGNIINESIRVEDDVFYLNNDMLAIIMPHTDKEGGEVVKERIKSKLDALHIDMNKNKYSITIDSKIAIVEYSNSIKNAIEYKQICEAELEYDV